MLCAHLTSWKFILTRITLGHREILRGSHRRSDDMTREDDLPAEGLVRLSQIVGVGRVLPIGKSTFWAGVKTGRFPQPIRIGRITAWRVEDIRALIAQTNT